MNPSAPTADEATPDQLSDMFSAQTGSQVGSQVSSQLSIGVVGMTCAACVARVERSLNKLDGVVEANVNLATEKASVSFMPELVTPVDLKNAVRGAGYEVVEQEAGKDLAASER